MRVSLQDGDGSRRPQFLRGGLTAGKHLVQKYCFEHNIGKIDLCKESEMEGLWTDLE